MGAARAGIEERANTYVGPLRRVDQVCELAADGLTDAQIAAQLSISRHTVVNYWRRLREKHQISSRTALVVAHLRERSNSEVADLRVRNKVLTEQNGRLIAENARATREIEQRHASYGLYNSILWSTKSFIYKASADSPYRCINMSPSAELFGINVDDFLCYRSSWFDIVVEEDIQALIDVSGNEDVEPETSYNYIYRLKSTKPTWIIDFQRLSHEDSDQVRYMKGLVVDASRLVESGALEPKVARISHTRFDMPSYRP
jgi:DNA-binding CsgD family transcriptional regulator